MIGSTASSTLAGGQVNVGLLLDTGPLVAILDGRDRHHAWATKLVETTRVPIATCEAVLSEACFVARRAGVTADQVVELARAIARAPTFRIDENDEAVRRLLEKYRSVPMSFADACLVRMSELHTSARVATFDADFRVYRRHGRQVVPTVSPSR